MAIFGKDNIFATPKPEELIQRIIHIASNPGDLVLDSFLGSGTTAAVAQKMGRRWIGVEMGNHAYTHCKVRMDKVIAGEDPGGITKAQSWQGGGGYRFYEVKTPLMNMSSTRTMMPICWQRRWLCTRDSAISRTETCSGNSL